MCVRLTLISARFVVNCQAAEHHCHLANTERITLLGNVVNECFIVVP